MLDMKVKFLFFARSRELAGTETCELEMQHGATSQDAWTAILAQYTSLKEIQGSCVLALNQEYVDAGTKIALKDGDELAVIPPISGG